MLLNVSLIHDLGPQTPKQHHVKSSIGSTLDPFEQHPGLAGLSMQIMEMSRTMYIQSFYLQSSIMLDVPKIIRRGVCLNVICSGEGITLIAAFYVRP